jgi:hypothetical protein
VPACRDRSGRDASRASRPPSQGLTNFKIAARIAETILVAISASTPWRVTRPRFATAARSLVFVGLLGAAPVLPHLSTNWLEFPGVSNFWTSVAFAALVLVPVLDWRALRQPVARDLIALLFFLVAFGCARPWISWPVLLIYPPLLYLLVSMVTVARGRPPRVTPAPLRLLVPRSWLVIAIAVLCAVHVSWALSSKAGTDIGLGSVAGARNITHGRAVYGKHGSIGEPLLHEADLHTDTYGPVNYEAYIPFASLTSTRMAQRLTTLFFALLTAVLLFVVGRRIRGTTTGVLLAYLWLAFPFTLYDEGLSLNDTVVAAAFVGTLIVAASPARRGLMAALTAWTKLSPLALVPLLASHHGARAGTSRRRCLEFLGAFALATVCVFLPVLGHSSPATFVSRTFGFQLTRSPGESGWALGAYARVAPWIAEAVRAGHGLIIAFAGGFGVALLRARRRQDAIGLAASCAAVLIAIEICMGYFSFSYILWFAPLVLVAVIGEGVCNSANESPADGNKRATEPRLRRRWTGPLAWSGARHIVR